MGPRQRILAAALAACALVCAFGALPARTLASATQQSILMDDDELVYASPRHVATVLGQLHALGVDAVKVSVYWGLVAPQSRPAHFDATNPAAYPAGAWDRYDTVVRLASALGMQTYFQLTPPSPRWALARGLPTGQGIPLGQAPNASQFGQFVQAVGRRYSGNFTVSSSSQVQDNTTLLGLPLNEQQRTVVTSSTIPRVSEWGIWNEPNFPSWLNPARRRVRGLGVQYVQPLLYRQLVDAAWTALQRTGHASDTVLIGETANFGSSFPIPFIEDLFCLSPQLRQLRGRAAQFVGCPANDSPASFRAAHPGLFAASGFAHHPYSFDMPPSQTPHPGWISLANVSVLEQVLNGVLGAYGGAPAGGTPLYLSEWGYKTHPPNPYVKTSLAHQASWLNEGEYLAWRAPYVKALDQFEYVDSGPRPQYPVGSRLYWGTFQTGLLFRNNRPKPSLQAFRIPIWLPVRRHGSSVSVWGHLRPANHTDLQYGVIEFKPRGGRRWSTLREVQTSNREGFLVAHVRIPQAGSVRLGWIRPGSRTRFTSLAVSVS